MQYLLQRSKKRLVGERNADGGRKQPPNLAAAVAVNDGAFGILKYVDALIEEATSVDLSLG